MTNLRTDRFSDAVAAYCHDATDPALFAWPLAKLVFQRNRYIVAYLLIHDEQAWRLGLGPAPTLSSLVRTSPISPRQTAQVVRAFRAAGLVTARPVDADRRALRLDSDPALVRAVASSMVAFVGAADLLDGTRRAPALKRDVARQAELIRRCADFVIRRDSTLLDDHPAVNAFARRDGGYAALMVMLTAVYAPQAATTPLTARGLSSRLGLSRSHAASLLREARQDGYLTIDQTGRRVTISPRFRNAVEAWFRASIDHYRQLANAL